MPTYGQLQRRKPRFERPEVGSQVAYSLSDRNFGEQSLNFTPQKVGRILEAAVSGQMREQSKLCEEILEKDWDMLTAVQTRKLAVSGTPWEILPADDSRAARKVAEAATRMLERMPDNQEHWGINKLLEHLAEGCVAGFAAAEIVWQPGFEAVSFNLTPAHWFESTLTAMADGSQAPAGPVCLRTDGGALVPLAYGKWVFHRNTTKDIVRGGLIRPLAWIYAFRNLNFKDLMAYVERYGMPFLLAQLDQDAWQRERVKVAQLVKGFGSSGGGVFTKSVELKMIEASKNNGELYLQLMEYFEGAATKVVLGQTSTTDSKDSNRSTAAVHNLVRGDILQADCTDISATISRDVLRPWTRLHHGDDRLAPRFRLMSEPAEDMEQQAGIVKTLSEAGHQVDPAQVEERFGWKIVKAATPASVPPAKNGDLIDPADLVDEADAIALDAENGSSGTLGASGALAELLAGSGMEEWLGPVNMAIASALRGEPSEVVFRARLQKLLRSLPELYAAMDTAALEQAIAGTMYAAAAEGAAARAAELRSKGGRRNAR